MFPKERGFHRALEKFRFYVYSMVLSKIGVRPPFTEFGQLILDQLRLAPTQLHPNIWAFLRAFELTMRALDCPLSVPLFVTIFNVVRSMPRFWASLRTAERSYLDFYSESIKDFKVNYLCVAALNTAAKRRLGEYERWKIHRCKVSSMLA